MLQSQWGELTVDQVNAAIRRHVDPSDLQVAVVHPSAAEFADVLASEAPSPIEYAAEVPAEVLAEDEAIVPFVVGIPRDRMTIIPLDSVFQ